ncbi:MAG: FAD-dependent oxidoreductase [Thermodesulfobacteriota bacterium]|nr:FAD-dependent oxidoreductase [Thermodesulfobacteriota bacterium]
MKNYLIVGNGVAGTTAAEHIRKIDMQGNVLIFSDEDFPFYWRIKLNEYLAGDINKDSLIVKKPQWYDQRRIEIRRNTRIIGGDPVKKTVISEDGQHFQFDSLLIATGSHSFIPPIKGSEKQGVFSLRNIRDAHHILQWADCVNTVVLIGGGLLGLETGNALRKRGKKVCVVEFFPRLLPRQLDSEGGKRLQDIMETMRFSFRLGTKTEEITGNDSVTGVKLEDGDIISSEMVVISAGVRSNLDLAGPLGLESDKGVQVDGHMRTNQGEIYAAGDVAEFQGITYGIWPAALDQGRIAGINMAGKEATYQGTTLSNVLKVIGIELASAGNIDSENRMQSHFVRSEGVYKKIVIENNCIVGCIMLGETKAFHKITQAISEKRDVSQIKDLIVAEGFDIKGI